MRNLFPKTILHSSPSYRPLSTSKYVQWTIVILLNLAIFLKIGLQTLIPTYILLGIYGGTSVLVYGLTQWILRWNDRVNTTFLGFGLTPLTLNLLLCVNYYTAQKPVQESYRFSHQTQNATSGRYCGREQKTSLIVLEGNTYHDYKGIRLFANYWEMKQMNRIVYTFEEGALGLRVMTDYQFINE